MPTPHPHDSPSPSPCNRIVPAGRHLAAARSPPSPAGLPALHGPSPGASRRSSTREPIYAGEPGMPSRKPPKYPPESFPGYKKNATPPFHPEIPEHGLLDALLSTGAASNLDSHQNHRGTPVGSVSEEITKSNWVAACTGNVSRIPTETNAKPPSNSPRTHQRQTRIPLWLFSCSCCCCCCCTHSCCSGSGTPLLPPCGLSPFSRGSFCPAWV